MKFNTMGYLATFFFAVFFAVGCKKEAVVDSVDTTTSSNLSSAASNRLRPCTLNPNSGNIIGNLSQVANCGLGPISIGDCLSFNTFVGTNNDCLGSFTYKGDINLTPITLEQMNEIIAAARAFGASHSPSSCHQLSQYEFFTEFVAGVSCIKVRVIYICCEHQRE